MTNTKFRKKALMSSVAMLIVALIAMSSATFAWYAANTQATAEGLTFTTTGESGLQIDTQSEYAANSNAHTWGRTATFADVSGGTGSLKPVSLHPDGTFYTTNSTGPSASTAKAGANITTLNSYIYDKVYFKLDDNGSDVANADVYVSGVTINAQSSNASEAYKLKDYIRVAIFNNDMSSVLYTGTVTDEASKAAAIAEYAPVASASQKYLKPGSGTYVDASTSEGTKTVLGPSGVVPTGITASKTPTHATDCVTVVVFLDGFGTNVTSDQATLIQNESTDALKAILESVQVSFELR